MGLAGLVFSIFPCTSSCVRLAQNLLGGCCLGAVLARRPRGPPNLQGTRPTPSAGSLVFIIPIPSVSGPYHPHFFFNLPYLQESACSKPDDDILDIPLDDPGANAAAAKIQASFRGHMARKKIKSGECGRKGPGPGGPGGAGGARGGAGGGPSGD